MRKRLTWKHVVLAAGAGVLQLGTAQGEQLQRQTLDEVLAAQRCDRECLIETMDEYLAAMVAHDPSRAPFAESVKFTENTAILPLTDGLWVTSVALSGDYRIYVPDVKTQQVGFIGVVKEHADHAILGLRLKVENFEITEAESIVARGQESLENYQKPSPDIVRDLTPAERVPREQMIAAVRQYMQGIEQSSGQIVPFDEDCIRRENGRQANQVDDFLNYPYLSGPPAPINFGKMGCREQLDTGIFAYITSVEDRRERLVDEQTGNVFGFFIFRHRGNVTTIDLPGYGEVPAPFAGVPFDTAMAELFKVRSGKIWRVEATGTRVPYGLPTGWDGQSFIVARDLGPQKRGPIPDDCDRTCLSSLVDQYMQAVAAHDPSKVPLAPMVKMTENGQVVEPGDGLWATTEALGRYKHYIADPKGRAVGFVTTIQEGGEMSALALRMKISEGWISEVEQLVFRSNRGYAPGSGQRLDAMTRRPIWDETLQPSERVPREQMIEIANAYFEKIEDGNGHHPTPFAEKCHRIENGEPTTNVEGSDSITALDCDAQISTGMFVFDTELRDRRFPVVDEEKGVVYAHVFFDHGGTARTWTHLQTGETHEVSPRVLRPHAYEIHEIFKIRNGRIHEIEAVLVDVPYKMRSNWEE